MDSALHLCEVPPAVVSESSALALTRRPILANHHISIAVQTWINLEPHLIREFPPEIHFGLPQKTLRKWNNFGIHVRLGTQRFKLFIRPLLPTFLRILPDFRSWIIKTQDLSETFSLPCHLFSAGLAQTDAVSSTVTELNVVAPITNIVQVASNVVPAKSAINRKRRVEAEKVKLPEPPSGTAIAPGGSFARVRISK